MNYAGQSAQQSCSDTPVPFSVEQTHFKVCIVVAA